MFLVVGTVGSTGASVHKFRYSTEKVQEYKWLARCLKYILAKQDFRVGWIHLAQGSIYASAIVSQPSGSLRCGECLASCWAAGFSTRNQRHGIFR